MITENETQDDGPKKALIYICGGKYYDILSYCSSILILRQSSLQYHYTDKTNNDCIMYFSVF